MPYISKIYREDARISPKNAGELNYCISEIVLEYIDNKGLKYDTLNEVMGVFTCALLENYRRLAAPYEQEKILQNGDLNGFAKYFPI